MSYFVRWTPPYNWRCPASTQNSQINTTEGSVWGKMLLTACFVGACPVVKGTQREVSYRHKECACDFLQEELREAHLHRRAIAIAYQQKDAKEA